MRVNWMLHKDHICLYSRGGKHTVENLRLLCPRHNNYLAIEALGKGFMKRYVTRLEAVHK